MYKLTLGSVNEIKASNTEGHGVFSGTIETDRVVIVDSDGKYLQTDGNWGTELKNGLVRTWSATLDSAEIEFLADKYAAKSATTAAVYVYDGVMVLQSAFASVDAFIEYLVDNGVIEIQGYENPDYKLNTVSVKSAGAGYTEDVVVQVPGSDGDTLGTITCTVDTDSTSATYKQVTAAAITTVGKYKSYVASQEITVPGGTTAAKLTVTMTEIE